MENIFDHLKMTKQFFFGGGQGENMHDNNYKKKSFPYLQKSKDTALLWILLILQTDVQQMMETLNMN